MKTKGIVKGLLLGAFLFGVMLPCLGHAIPQKINYQGYLTDSQGVPVHGSVTMAFALYTQASGGIALWTETQNVAVTNGVYNIDLGDVTPINLAFDTQYYLGIKVGADPEMTPRQPLTSVPYAFRAKTVENAGTGTITGVTAGTGLTGGGTTGSVTLSVLPSYLLPQGCGSGRIPSWNGSSWVCATDQNSGGTITGVTAGSGLTGGGTVGNVPLSVAQITQTMIVPPINLTGSFYNAPTLQGYNTSDNGEGVRGWAAGNFGTGVYGNATRNGGYGVHGSASALGGAGVYGEASGYLGAGVWGKGSGLAGTAGHFDGGVSIYGGLYKSSGSFKIDHPLDPENKYLYHSFVESPDMMNIYNGNVVLDSSGEAWVELPEWFEALNKDFRYQLTCIGGFAQVYIAKKVSDNRFKIAGGISGLEVSWQVTGIRKDPYAEAHRIPVEELKKPGEQGYYIFPDLYGHPEEKGIQWAHHPEMMKKMKAEREKVQRSNGIQEDMMVVGK